MEEAGGDAWKLVILVAENFQCYHDVAEFKGRTVSLLKRAQIFVSDVHFMFQGESFGKLEGMDRLTMFPDYRVPQVSRCVLGWFVHVQLLCSMYAYFFVEFAVFWSNEIHR